MGMGLGTQTRADWRVFLLSFYAKSGRNPSPFLPISLPSLFFFKFPVTHLHKLTLRHAILLTISSRLIL